MHSIYVTEVYKQNKHRKISISILFNCFQMTAVGVFFLAFLLLDVSFQF